MLSSVPSVSPRASLVDTRKEYEMVFKGNCKFENGAGSTALIFKSSLPNYASKVPPNVWTIVSGLLIFELYKVNNLILQCL